MDGPTSNGCQIKQTSFEGMLNWHVLWVAYLSLPVRAQRYLLTDYRWWAADWAWVWTLGTTWPSRVAVRNLSRVDNNQLNKWDPLIWLETGRSAPCKTPAANWAWIQTSSPYSRLSTLSPCKSWGFSTKSTIIERIWWLHGRLATCVFLRCK